MKKWMGLIILLVLVVALSACGQSKANSSANHPQGKQGGSPINKDMPQVEFIGIVQEVGENGLLVAEAENELNLIWFTTEQLPEGIEPGDMVKILFSGIVAESYPGQAQADSVEIVKE